MNDFAKRTRIGRNNDFATRQIVYRTPNGVEVDELDHFEVVRRRVAYDDVILVTYHREQSWGTIVFMAAVLILFGILAVTASSVPSLAMALAGVAALALVFADAADAGRGTDVRCRRGARRTPPPAHYFIASRSCCTCSRNTVPPGAGAETPV